MSERVRRFITNLASAWRAGGLREVWRLLRTRYGVRLGELWASWWLHRASLSPIGRLAVRIAAWAPLPYSEYFQYKKISELSPFGYLAPSATIRHDNIQLGTNVFISDRVHFLKVRTGCELSIGNRVVIGADAGLSTGDEASLMIGSHTYIGPRCLISAHVANITIGSHVLMGGDCKLISYSHGIEPDMLIGSQPLVSKGEIVIEDDVWLGTGTIVLSGVRIGTGAVVGAGSVVTKNVPAGGIVAGNPARLVNFRGSPARLRQANLGFVDRDDVALVVRTQEGTIRFWSRGAEHLYGWEGRDVLGRRSHDLLRTIFPKPLVNIDEELKNAGRWEGELVHVRRDGSCITVKSRWEVQSEEEDASGIVVEINTV